MYSVGASGRTLSEPFNMPLAGLFLSHQRLGQVQAESTRGIVGGDDLRGYSYSGLGFDASPQFEVAQRVQAVVGERAVGIYRAAQDQAGLLRYQAPQPD